jgi:creatinine amidohydrolase
MLYERLTWHEAREAAANDCLVVLPVGSVEEHGPHLPLATDVYSVARLAELLAVERGDVVVAPAIFYGHAPVTRGFPGTISIRGETLASLIENVLTEFERQGFRRILVFSGHFENTPFIVDAIERARERTQSDGARMAVTTWWDLIANESIAEIFGADFTWSGTHASFPETSLALVLSPEIVRHDELVDDRPSVHLSCFISPVPTEALPLSGVYGDATRSTEQVGALLRDAALAGLERLINDYLPRHDE